MSDDEKLAKWIETHDGDDYCRYCIYDSDCAHEVRCYGGPTIEPPCCDKEIEELLDTEAILADITEETESE